MKNILICGACGAMGKTLYSVLQESETNLCAVCGVDIAPTPLPIPVYKSFSKIKEQVDVVVDFSSPSMLLERLEFAKEKKIGIVIATTGFSAKDRALLEKYAERVAIFQAANFSPAVFYMKKIVEELSQKLPAFDLSIIETHHKNKKDAPSGTAKTLACQRANTPVFSLRGGTAVGTHQAVFLGEDESLEITHRAQSKKIFAIGAIKACQFLLKKDVGLYGMEDL